MSKLGKVRVLEKGLERTEIDLESLLRDSDRNTLNQQLKLEIQRLQNNIKLQLDPSLVQQHLQNGYEAQVIRWASAAYGVNTEYTLTSLTGAPILILDLTEDHREESPTEGLNAAINTALRDPPAGLANESKIVSRYCMGRDLRGWGYYSHLDAMCYLVGIRTGEEMTRSNMILKFLLEGIGHDTVAYEVEPGVKFDIRPVEDELEPFMGRARINAGTGVAIVEVIPIKSPASENDILVNKQQRLLESLTEYALPS